VAKVWFDRPMIREAELFVMAEDMLPEVLGRIRIEHQHHRAADARHAQRRPPRPIRDLVAHYSPNDAWVPDCSPDAPWPRSAQTRATATYWAPEAHAALARIMEARARGPRHHRPAGGPCNAASATSPRASTSFS
jgi:hypothetical protein